MTFTIDPASGPDQGLILHGPQGSVTAPRRAALQTLQNYADKGKLLYRSKELAADFYVPIEAYVKFETMENHLIQVSTRVHWRRGDFALTDCDHVFRGPPHWIIMGGALKVLGDFPAEHLYNTPLSLTSQEAAHLAAALAAKEVRIEVSEGASLQLGVGADPLPCLRLTDRWGSFADLWLDYGSRGQVRYEGSSSSSWRQTKAERLWEQDLLETGYLIKPTPTARYHCPLDKIAKSLSFLLELGWMITDARKRQIKAPGTSELHLSAALVLQGRIKYGEHSLDLSQAAGAFNRRETFVDLTANTVGLLPSMPWQQLVEAGEIVTAGIQLRRTQIGELQILPEITYDSSLKQLVQGLENFCEVAQALPKDQFTGSLRPYQQQGVNWLAFLYDHGFAGLLADDMGLGKTVQVLAFLSRLLPLGRHLIVLPTSLLFSWNREILRFLPGASVHIHHGAARQLQTEAQIVLTSYATLRQDLLIFSQQDWHCVILDEAQAIKNPDTQTFKSVCRLRARFRLSITGTPIENRLDELWAQFRFLQPQLLGDRQAFSASAQTAQADSRHLTQIRKQIKPFLLRRTKEQVAPDLPPLIDQITWIEMPASQRQIYDEFLTKTRQGVLKKVALDGLQAHRMEILESILRLRQICCHPLLVDASAKDESAKLERLLEDLETLFQEGRKVLIYSQFSSMLQLIAGAFGARGWSFCYLDGSTQNREKEVDRFQNEPGVSAFLVSLKAGGVGLNLTAADYVFIYDPWWNEAAEQQAINRAHRIGRLETVFAKRFILAESIEEKMLKLKLQKKTLAEDLLSGQGDQTGLSSEDFAFLLS